MSFWTTFSYYHPGPAPIVTASDLAQLVRAFIETGVLRRDPCDSAEIVLEDANYPRVSPSLETMLAPEYRARHLPDPDPGYSVLSIETIRASRRHRRLLRFLSRPFQPAPPPWPDRHQLSFDVRPSLADIAGFLDSFGEAPLVHAFVMLGQLPEDTVRRLDVKSPENTCTASPYGVALQLAQVSVFHLGSDRAFCVGQLSLGISGPGYCFPRTPREIIDAIRTDPGVTPLLDILDDTWPTGVLQIEHARDLLSATLEPKLWPYDNITHRPEPPHWLWGVTET